MSPLEVENGGVDGLSHSSVRVLGQGHQLEAVHLLLHLLRGLDGCVNEIDVFALDSRVLLDGICRQSIPMG